MVTEQTNQPKMRTSDVSVFYGDKKAVDGVSIDIPREFVTAFIGPSGCGKSTFLRALNRMNDTIPSARVEGTIDRDGTILYRFRAKDYRFYVEVTEDAVVVHRVLHKGTFSDFKFRSKMPLAEDEALGNSKYFWKLIDEGRNARRV